MKTDLPLVSLKEETLSQVKELVLIGDLLEVTLEEMAILIKVLQSSLHPPSQLEEILLPCAAAQAEAIDDAPRARGSTGPKKRPPNEDGSGNLVPRSPAKKLKYTMQERSRGIVRKRSSAGGNKEKRKHASKNDEEEEVCAAGACKKPFGSQVQWVQCDGCDLWFHYLCVGLGLKGVSEDEEYLCDNCRGQHTKELGSSWRDC